MGLSLRLGMHMGSTVAVSGGGAPDTTAPTLSSPVGTQTGSTTATIGATTNEGNGTMYGVVTTSSTAPTATQVKAGQNNGGTAAVFAGSVAVSSTGAKTISATGLTASTAYYAHIMHEDAAGNKSSVVSSAQFTTAGATATVWDSAFNSSNWTLTNAGLTATRAAGSGDQSQIANQGKTSGYFEVVIDSLTAGGVSIGLGDAAISTSQSVGFSGNGVAIYSGDGTVYHGGGSARALTTLASGDVVGICLKGGKLYYSKNGTWMGGDDPSAGTGGLDISAYLTTAYPAISSNVGSGCAMTARFASGFSYTVPTGVSAWG